MALGRPRFYPTPESFQAAIDSYFDTVEGMPTFSGLARHLGMTRRRMIDYDKRDGYEEIAEQARLRLEEMVERHLLTAKNVIGAIFWLKNNAGWSDTRSLAVSGGDKPLVTEIKITLVGPESTNT